MNQSKKAKMKIYLSKNDSFHELKVRYLISEFYFTPIFLLISI